jgi:hypothetical protein
LDAINVHVPFQSYPFARYGLPPGMKKLTLLLLLSGSGLFVLAQKAGKITSFGLGLQGGVSPNVATTQFVNFGMTARYSIHAGPGYAYIGTGFMASREGFDFQIPLRIGYKFIFSKKFFVSEEPGYYFFRDPDSYEGLTTDHGLSIATSVGVQFGIFDLGLQYDVIVNHNNFSTIGFILGWNF